jgi:hypothetical protein
MNAIEQIGIRIGRAIAHDTLADDLPRGWTGLDPQDVDQIPDELREHAAEITRIAHLAYQAALMETH